MGKGASLASSFIPRASAVRFTRTGVHPARTLPRNEVNVADVV